MRGLDGCSLGEAADGKPGLAIGMNRSDDDGRNGEDRLDSIANGDDDKALDMDRVLLRVVVPATEPPFSVVLRRKAGSTGKVRLFDSNYTEVLGPDASETTLSQEIVSSAAAGYTFYVEGFEAGEVLLEAVLRWGENTLRADEVRITVLDCEVLGAHVYGSLNYAKAYHVKDNEFVCGGACDAQHPLHPVINIKKAAASADMSTFKDADGHFLVWLSDETEVHFYQELADEAYYDSLIWWINFWREWVLHLPPIQTSFAEVKDKYGLTDVAFAEGLYYVGIFSQVQPPGYTSGGTRALQLYWVPSGLPVKGCTYQLHVVSVDLDVNVDNKPKNAQGIPVVSTASDITDSDEELESSVGGYIWVNDDKDNPSANILDMAHPGGYLDNDLEPVIVRVPALAFDVGMTAELHVYGSEVVTLWSDPQKSHRIVLNTKHTSMESLDADGDGVLYVEGIQDGVALVDLSVESAGNTYVRDRIEMTVTGVSTVRWEGNIGESHPNAMTCVVDPPVGPPPGETRPGMAIFPDRSSLSDTSLNDIPCVSAWVSYTGGETGWEVPLYGCVLDVDHYHSSTDFDPNGAVDPNDNQTGHTGGPLFESGNSQTIGIRALNEMGTLRAVVNTDAEVRWGECIGSGMPRSEVFLEITEHTPCNNWTVAVGMGDTLHEAVRIRPADGRTIEYVDGTALTVKGAFDAPQTASLCTQCLTVWRNLYAEEHRMGSVDFTDGPENERSLREGPVFCNGTATVWTEFDILVSDQFENGWAQIYDRREWPFGDELLFVGRIVGNSSSTQHNATVTLGSPIPAAGDYIHMTDDDVLALVVVDREATCTPLVQPAHADTSLCNAPGMFPAACVYVDTCCLDAYDSVIPFALGLDDLAGRGKPTIFEVVRDAKRVRGGADFWVVTSIGAYQKAGFQGPNYVGTNDPDSMSCIFGCAPPYWDPAVAPDERGAAFEFVEGIRDAVVEEAIAGDTLAGRRARVCVHEVGHLLGGRHGDGQIMADPTPYSGDFHPKSLRRFMLLHDDGPGVR